MLSQNTRKHLRKHTQDCPLASLFTGSCVHLHTNVHRENGSPGFHCGWTSRNPISCVRMSGPPFLHPLPSTKSANRASTWHSFTQEHTRAHYSDGHQLELGLAWPRFHSCDLFLALTNNNRRLSVVLGVYISGAKHGASRCQF